MQIEKHKSVRWAERTASWFVLFDLQIFLWWCLAPSATSRTISFSISNSFLVLIWFIFSDGGARNSIVGFGASIPCHAIWQIRRRMRTVSKSATYLATESVKSAPFKRGVRERGANFWQGKVQNSSPILRCTFWQGKVQNSYPISALLRWRHFRLSLSLSLSVSLSLSPSAPHAQYRKRFRAFYNKRAKLQSFPKVSSDPLTVSSFRRRCIGRKVGDTIIVILFAHEVRCKKSFAKLNKKDRLEDSSQRHRPTPAADWAQCGRWIATVGLTAAVTSSAVPWDDSLWWCGQHASW